MAAVGAAVVEAAADLDAGFGGLAAAVDDFDDRMATAAAATCRRDVAGRSSRCV